jgi:bifunctional DNase/RNase
MENLPIKKIKSTKLNNVDSLELIPVKLEHILISPDNHTFALIAADDKDIAIPLNSYEGSMLSFVFKGLHKNSHINTIHQLFVKFINDQDTKIESIYLESKVGDIIYASIHFVDKKHRRYYSVCSLIDALILSLINKTQLYVVKNAWDKIDSFDDWQYDEFIIDWSNE